MARVRPQTSSLIPGLFRQRAADVQTPADVRFVTHVVDNIEIKKNAKVFLWKEKEKSCRRR